jgi:Uma2 family endonuclease
MATTTRMTLDEFLALPEEKPYLEYVDGEVCPKPMPTRRHGRIAARFIKELGNVLGDDSQFEVLTEVRHHSQRRNRLYLPDVEVSRRSSSTDDPVPEPPDIAIEILSPDDRASRVLDRVDFYLSEGVQIVWVVDPETESVTEYRPGGSMQVLRHGASIDGAPVLEGFQLPIDDLFAATS